MTMLLSRPCSVQTCKGVALPASRHCKDHAGLHPTHHAREDRGTTTQQGYGTTWQKLRLLKLQAHPLCERCKAAGVVKASSEVHHIQPLSKGGDNAMSNL